MSTLIIQLLSSKSKKKSIGYRHVFPINPQWLKLPMSRINSQGPKYVWVFEGLLYFVDTKIIWATSSEKVPLNMFKMCKFRSFCACANYCPGIYSPFIHSVYMYVVSKDFVCGQRRPWSDRGCAGCSELSRTARHVFAWRGPYPG